MELKYWEYEDAPIKEKMKNPTIKDIARVFFDNDTEAYRFAAILLQIKKMKEIKLKDVPKDIPLATAKRYLEFAIKFGMVKHENGVYVLTDRFSQPLKNFAAYIKAWSTSENEEDLSIEFPNAKKEKQKKRGGRFSPAYTTSQESDQK
ncbi:MAG: hypothetical protein ACP5RP_00170 [Candidatus Micrarchaeia archaeon]